MPCFTASVPGSQLHLQGRPWKAEFLFPKVAQKLILPSLSVLEGDIKKSSDLFWLIGWSDPICEGVLPHTQEQGILKTPLSPSCSAALDQIGTFL